MKRLMIIYILLIISFLRSIANEDFLINVYNRTTISLNGEWNYIVDPYENGYYDYRLEPYENKEPVDRRAYFLNTKPEKPSDLVEYNFDKSDNINVPGDWNTQKEKLFYYEGTVWYKTSFDYTSGKTGNRVFLYFEAVNYQADVYLNGKKLGTHIGGFTPFCFEVTNIIKEKDNFLIVKADNKRIRDGVPTINIDWWNYGGITRDVKLVETANNFIRDYFIQLNPEDKNQIKGYISLDGEDVGYKKINVKIPELKINKEIVTDDKGTGIVEIDIKKIRYWSTVDPFLYDVTISTPEDEITDQIGFRTISIAGHNILLNDNVIYLRGISIHEENPIRGGRAYSTEDARQLLNWAKELNCNYVRLAHYPHNEHMVRLADQMGILVWEENPVYWTISWENKGTYKNAENQLTELISRDKNRASVIIWSMANETPASDARNTFLTGLAKKARELDPTRLLSAALEQNNYIGDPFVQTIDDPYAEVVDVLSFNQYIGWYNGLPEKCREINWKITQNKPVLISEFGAGAKYGYHGNKMTRWTEEFQEYLYIETLDMIDKIPQLRGFSPWILVDFRSPRRPLPGIQEGYNRKGLFSEKGEKKKAFYVLKEFYDKKSEIYK